MGRSSVSHDPNHFAKWLDEGVILRDGVAVSERRDALSARNYIDSALSRKR